MNIVFWLSAPSHYRMGAIRCLANSWPGNVTAVFENSKFVMYRGLDLQQPPFGKIHPVYLDTLDATAQAAQTIVDENADAIHIMQCFSPRLPLFKRVVPRLLTKPSLKLSFFVERPRQYLFWDGLVREVAYRWRSTKYRRKIAAVLALGSLGAESYCRFGIEPHKVFPMSYCVDHEETPITDFKIDKEGPIRFIHLAGLQESYRKGLDLIFAALASIGHGNWTCDILGFDPKPELLRKLRVSDDDKRIRWLGQCKNTEVFRHISQNDILLLPSRHDGWGVALAEGIYCGLGGIASDKVGSKDLIDSFDCGKIVKAGSVQELAKAMLFCIENRNEVGRWKENSLKYRHLVKPEAVGHYLKQVLEHVFIDHYRSERPHAPWHLSEMPD